MSKKLGGLSVVLLAACMADVEPTERAAQAVGAADSGVRDWGGDAASDATAMRQRETSAAAFARRGSERAPTRAQWESFRASGRAGTVGASGASGASGAASLSGGITLVPRTPHAKPSAPIVCADVLQYNVVRVKFVEGTHLRLDANGALYSDAGPAMTPALVAELAAINARPDTQRQPTLSTSVADLLLSKEDAEKESGEEHADPTLWFDMLDGVERVEVASDPVVCDRTAALVNWLNAMEIVELAYPVPAMVEPPWIPWMSPGYDLTFNAAAVHEPPHMAPWRPMNMNFGLNSPEESPLLHASFRSLWQGSGVNLVDMEYGWFWHEKIGDVYRIPGGVLNTDRPYMNHAVASMSIAFGTSRSSNFPWEVRYGTRGFAPMAGRAFSAASAVWGQNIPDGIERARLALDPEDVLLIEQQTHVGTGSAVTGGGRGAFLTAVEHEEATYDCVRRATANRRILIEPTGNGLAGNSNNMDVLIGGRLNSGAIVVAANAAEAQAGMSLPLTGFGARVDANAWGSSVYAAADWNYLGPNTNLLPAGATNSETYTLAFNSTSSASACVAGAVTQMVAVYQGAYGTPLAPAAQTPAVVRALIQSGGTPAIFESPRYYGVQPNVERTVTEFILATRIHPFAPHVSTPHNVWVSTAAGAGVLPVWEWSNAAWAITQQNSEGVSVWEYPFATPTGPLDLGWNPDCSFTIEARIQVGGATDQWQTIVAKENPRNFGLWVAPNWYNSGRLHFSYQPDGWGWLCGSYSNAVVADGLVHHVAVRFDRRAAANGAPPVTPQITFFVDGVQDSLTWGCTDAEPAASGNYGQNGMVIGANMALWSRVGDVRLYHRFVNDAEITSHHNGS